MLWLKGPELFEKRRTLFVAKSAKKTIQEPIIKPKTQDSKTSSDTHDKPLY